VFFAKKAFGFIGGNVATRPGCAEVEISQKLQARALEGSTAPHSKQVLVTGRFCAADAHTPVRSVPKKINTPRDAVKILL
jgi:hypothetical protein